MTRELRKRIITSTVLIAIVLNCLFINNLSWLFLLSIISLICWFEFFNLSRKIWRSKIIIILSTFFSFIFLCLFSYAAYKPKIDYGEGMILFVLGVCIFSDIGGYVVGKSIGGKKLTKISPKKTVSGSIGSFLFSLFPVGISTVIGEENFGEKAILGCLVISLACQLGDLVISYFKRLAKVKDTGDILPGHGGMLDRIDGIIFALPVLLIFPYFS